MFLPGKIIKVKFSILQQDLLPNLASVARSVGVHSTLPVLDNILLSAEGKNLKITATNLEIGVIKNIPAEVEAEGEITVPAKTLVEIISGLTQTVVSFESEGENLNLTSNKFKATINGIAASEFPAIPLSKEKGISFPKQAFLTSSQILFASAVDEGRPVLTGVLTNVSAGKLDFVATDGFRLAHRQLKLEDKSTQFKSLIPRRTFEEIVRIISEEEVTEVNIATSPDQNQAEFRLGKTIVSSRLIEGNFPSWEKIIPTTIVGRALIDRDLFIKAIKLAAVFSKSEANIVSLTTKKDGLSLQSSAKELGSQENIVEASVEGEDLQISFNTKFLLDAITNIPTTQVSVEFSGPLSATLIKPIGEEGLEFIIMPVRLS